MSKIRVWYLGLPISLFFNGFRLGQKDDKVCASVCVFVGQGKVQRRGRKKRAIDGSVQICFHHWKLNLKDPQQNSGGSGTDFLCWKLVLLTPLWYNQTSKWLANFIQNHSAKTESHELGTGGKLRSHLVHMWFYVFLFCIKFISSLIFIISFLLLTLGLVCSFSNSLRCKVTLFKIFLNVGIYHDKLPC